VNYGRKAMGIMLSSLLPTGVLCFDSNIPIALLEYVPKAAALAMGDLLPENSGRIFL
jgi:hypothetical protein